MFEIVYFSRHRQIMIQISKMARKKTKEAKIKPSRCFNGKSQTQYTIKIRNRIIVLASEGYKKEEVEKMLKLEIMHWRLTW